MNWYALLCNIKNYAVIAIPSNGSGISPTPPAPTCSGGALKVYLTLRRGTGIFPIFIILIFGGNCRPQRFHLSGGGLAAEGS